MGTEAKPYEGIRGITIARSNDVVYTRLRQAIVSGLLRSGQRLIEKQLADQLGVSRAPLREAIRVLQREGLVTQLPRRGIIVSIVTKTDIAEIYDLRTALECWATRVVCERATESSIRKLRQLVEAIDRASNTGDVGLLRDEDVRFHRTICELSGNQRLLDAWLTNFAQIRLLSAQSLDAIHAGLQLVPRRHQLIVDAIRAGNADAAAECMREHIATAASRVLEATPG